MFVMSSANTRPKNELLDPFSHHVLVVWHQVPPQEENPPILVNLIDIGSAGFWR
jgi:hypothetical protein